MVSAIVCSRGSVAGQQVLCQARWTDSTCCWKPRFYNDFFRAMSCTVSLSPHSCTSPAVAQVRPGTGISSECVLHTACDPCPCSLLLRHCPLALSSSHHPWSIREIGYSRLDTVLLQLMLPMVGLHPCILLLTLSY